MISLEDVLKLADLGFTKDEILSMQSGAGESEEPAGNIPTTEAAPAAPTPEPAAPAVDTNAALLDAIADLKKTIQKSNLATTAQSVDTQTDIQAKAEEELLKMYNM